MDLGISDLPSKQRVRSSLFALVSRFRVWSHAAWCEIDRGSSDTVDDINPALPILRNIP